MLTVRSVSDFPQNLVNGLPDADDWSESTEDFEGDESLSGIQASGITGLNYASPSRVQSPPMKALNSSPLKASTSIFSPTAFSPQGNYGAASAINAIFCYHIRIFCDFGASKG